MGEFCLYSHDTGKNLVQEAAKSMKCRTNEDPTQDRMEQMRLMKMSLDLAGQDTF